MLGIFSSGMRSIPHLDVLLGEEFVYSPAKPAGLRAIAGWGYKPTAQKARECAKSWGLPYISVEDGFLRSLGLGVQGHAPLSIVLDTTGVYYNAGAPSDLESHILAKDFSHRELDTARQAMAAIRYYGLSKYNHAPDLCEQLFPDDGKKRVLLLDQTRNDVSVTLGGADETTFLAMIEAAKNEYPEAHLAAKVHPDVLSGKKSGYLTETPLPGVTLLGMEINPLSLLEQVDVVYTVSSQMGFEALLLGKEVHCFGLPFYAGWGLTRDRLRCERRNIGRTLEEVFAGAYLRYARYLDPFLEESCGILRVIDILADQRRHNERNRGAWVCSGFSFWRRGFAKYFLSSTQGSVLFAPNLQAARKKAEERDADVVVWAASYSKLKGRHAPAPDDPTPTRIEDGFIRSTGLGSDYYWPYSLCIDSRGIYFDPTSPCDLEEILATTEFDDRLLARAVDLRKTLVDEGVTKYNVGDSGCKCDVHLIEAAQGRDIVLVVGQVEDDASVQKGGMGIHSNLDLLKAVRENRPDACIVYKPHPDVLRGNRKGHVSHKDGSKIYDLTQTNIPLTVLFPMVKELHTLTSLSGFEALLRDVPVHTYGGPFYAGWGLTTDRIEFPRRGRKLSLDALVAGVLILYPSYFDWRTEMFCGPEVVMRRLKQGGEPRQGRMERALCRAWQRACFWGEG